MGKWAEKRAGQCTRWRKFKQPARGFPRGSVENEKDDSLLPAILPAILPACLPCKVREIDLASAGADSGIAAKRDGPRGEEGRGLQRSGVIANDEWKMCGKLLRQNRVRVAKCCDKLEKKFWNLSWNYYKLMAILVTQLAECFGQKPVRGGGGAIASRYRDDLANRAYEWSGKGL